MAEKDPFQKTSYLTQKEMQDIMEKQLSDENIAELREAFYFYDKDGNGVISANELEPVLNLLGITATKDDIQKMIEAVDLDGSGNMNFKEFILFMEERMRDVPTEKELLQAFQTFDKDGNGFISTSELRYIMGHLGFRLPVGEIDDMVHEADIDGDGQVNYEDFIKILLN